MYVSTDNSNWNVLFDSFINVGEITDSAWTAVEYDISAYADNQTTVYISWELVTDSSLV